MFPCQGSPVTLLSGRWKHHRDGCVVHYGSTREVIVLIPFLLTKNLFESVTVGVSTKRDENLWEKRGKKSPKASCLGLWVSCSNWRMSCPGACGTKLKLSLWATLVWTRLSSTKVHQEFPHLFTCNSSCTVKQCEKSFITLRNVTDYVVFSFYFRFQVRV